MPDEKFTFFFDLDNCLYSQSHGISQLMGDKIQAFFGKSLSLSVEDARNLHHRYYKDYGLALQGLIRHHQIDPMHYNAEVDDALPLEQCLTKDAPLRQFLQRIDRSRVRTWILTNAYVTHARRVLKLLGVEDQFEGITYCDYSEGENLTCKPYPEFYARAMRESGAQDKDQCYFVDDSLTNVEGSLDFGWVNTVHFKEPLDHPTGVRKTRPDCHFETVHKIQDLEKLYPHLFLPRNELEL